VPLGTPLALPMIQQSRLCKSCVLLLTSMIVLAGCTNGSTTRPPASTSRPKPVATDGRSGNGRPVAIIGGVRVEIDSLRPLLAEAAGASVLEEVILDAALARELGSPLSTFGRDEVERERAASIGLIRGETGLSEAEAIEQLERSRIARGLGPARFDGLLRRNAAMRRLVAAEVSVSADELRLARDMNFGDRVRARLLVVRSSREAEQLRSRLAAGGDFAEVARSRSLDPSASDGGLLESVSWQDPAVPLPLQQALRDTPPGEISPVVALDGASAIVRVEQRLGATGSGVSDTELETRIRLRKERVAMDALASRLIVAMPVTVFDDNLRWAWETRGR